MNIPFQKHSKRLLNLMFQNYCSNHEEEFTKLTIKILKEIYEHFIKADYFLKNVNISDRRTYEKINTLIDIPKPSDFSYIIKNIRTEIHKISRFKTEYNFNLFKREIKIHIISNKLNLKENDKYVYRILMWLYVITKYNTDKSCSKKLNIYIYLTPLLKFLPSSKIEKIDKYHVNTGFTTTCSKNSNIVIYRKEEWFKVFIHETFHNLGLDFSGMSNVIAKKRILKIFPIKSEVNLYEAYTDAWAKIINIFIYSYLVSNKSFTKYIENVNVLINLEKTYSIFQQIKILKFMGLTYYDLYSKDSKSKELRDALYYEKTSVLSYYIINSIIMHKFQDFFKLCHENNINILQVDKTRDYPKKLAIFVEENYKHNSMLSAIECITDLLDNLEKQQNKSNDIIYLLNNMRKSLCEME